MLKFSISSLLLASTLIDGSSASQEFKYGDTIKWLADMQTQYSFGIFCSKLVVVLSNNDDQSSIDLSTHSPDPGEYGPLVKDFLGNRFVVSVPASKIFAAEVDSELMRLRLDCVKQQSRVTIRVELAESELFSVDILSARFARIPNGQNDDIAIQDTSIVDANLNWQCPISQAYPKTPVRVHNLVYDANYFFEYLETIQRHRKFEDVYHRPIEKAFTLKREILEQRSKYFKYLEDNDEELESRFNEMKAKYEKLERECDLETAQVHGDSYEQFEELWPSRDDRVAEKERMRNMLSRRTRQYVNEEVKPAFITYTPYVAAFTSITPFILQYGVFPLLRLIPFLSFYERLVRAYHPTLAPLLRVLNSEQRLQSKMIEYLQVVALIIVPICSVIHGLCQCAIYFRERKRWIKQHESEQRTASSGHLIDALKKLSDE